MKSPCPRRASLCMRARAASLGTASPGASRAQVAGIAVRRTAQQRVQQTNCPSPPPVLEWHMAVVSFFFGRAYVDLYPLLGVASQRVEGLLDVAKFLLDPARVERALLRVERDFAAAGLDVHVTARRRNPGG